MCIRDSHKSMCKPRGFAHGFVVLSKTAVFSYKCDNFYSKKDEGGFLHDSKSLKIDWMVPQNDRIISDKDKVLPAFS